MFRLRLYSSDAVGRVLAHFQPRSHDTYEDFSKTWDKLNVHPWKTNKSISKCDQPLFNLASSLLFLKMLNKLTHAFPQRQILWHFVNANGKVSWALKMILCVVLHAGNTPVGGLAYRKTCSREFYRKKYLYRGLESKLVKCLCWKAQLYLYPATVFYFLASAFLLSVCQSRLWRSLSFLQGDAADMPWAKGNLFCTSSMHHVEVSVESTSRKCERDRKASIGLLQGAQSSCYSCYSQETQLRSSSATRAFHISVYWTEQDLINLLWLLWFCWTNKCPMRTLPEKWDTDSRCLSTPWHLKYHPNRPKHNQ